MQINLKSLHLTDFKGVKDQTYTFGDITRIMAANGGGKSTIATGWFWLFVDRDYSLRSNPNVVPLGVEECLPRVEATLDIDGVEVVIAKQQKITTGKPDARGVSKTTTSNTYEINSVPKTERDFRADLEEKGFNFELFLPLSHPNVFTGQKAVDMRKVLFKMVTDKTDLDVALETDGAADVAELLKKYKFDEIDKMNKASKKKAEDQVKAIPNQIIGLEKAKVEVDTMELELQETGLKGQIAEKEKLLADNQSILEEYQKATDGIMDLKFKMGDIEQKATDDLNAQKKVIQDRADKAMQDFCTAMREQSVVELDINRLNDNIQRDDAERKGLGADYKAMAEKAFDESKWVFDENSTICPMCGREYAADKVGSIKEEFAANKEKAKNAFEKEKQAKMQKLIDRGNALKDKVTAAQAEVEKLNTKLDELKQQKMAANKSKTVAMEELAALPEQADISDNQEYEAMQLELSNMEKSLESMNNGASYRSVLKEEIEELRRQLSEVSAQIAKASNNTDIDKQISELREKQRDYEQAKADAEKILYQLSLVSKRKNEMLVQEINSNFSIVRWKLFDYQKNGEYKEVCVPQIDGKDFGDSTNTGREIIAKLDICNSLQKFFGMSVPIILDNAESINDERIPAVDCQLIMMKVTDDAELSIEI